MVSPFPGMFDESYAGYITVNQIYNSNLFFWFFPARVGVQGLEWRAGGQLAPDGVEILACILLGFVICFQVCSCARMCVHVRMHALHSIL